MRSLARHSHSVNYLKRFVMRILHSTLSIVALFSLVLLSVVGCSNPLGKSVKEPFSGSKYESNNRYYQHEMDQARMDNVAQSQAELRARQQLAQQVQT